MTPLNEARAACTALAGSPEGMHDVMDAVVGLQPGDPLYEVRHGREKVAVAMQKNYDVFFDPAAAGLSLPERLLVALHACVLSRADALADHYRQVLRAHAVSPACVAAVEAGTLDALADTRLHLILGFTRKLIVRPVEGDAQEIERLTAGGIAAPDIVTLAQLIAFLSYQVRVAAGLFAMKELASQ